MNTSISPAKVSVKAMIFSVVVIIIVGLMIGAVVSVISRLLYLIIIFPIAMGVIGGIVVERTIKSNKIRNAQMGIILSLLAACMIYGALHYTDYLFFRGQAILTINQKMVEEKGASNVFTANRLVDVFLTEEVGVPGFLGYTFLEAKNGISVGHVFSGSSSSLNIGTFLTWAYWLLEFGIIIGFTTSAARKASSQPFCDMHDKWYGKEQHLGGVEISQAQELWNFAKQKNFAQLGKMLKKDASVPSVEVYLQSCENCHYSDPLLRLKQTRFDKNGRVTLKNILATPITPLQRRDLMQEDRFAPPSLQA